MIFIGGNQHLTEYISVLVYNPLLSRMSSSEDEQPQRTSLNQRPSLNDKQSDESFDEVNMEEMIKSLFESRSNANKLCDILKYLQVTTH